MHSLADCELDVWNKGWHLQGGSQAIAQALLRGIAKYGGHLMLRSPVSRIHRTLHPPYNAVAVECFNGRRIDVGEAVVSNASVWDTESLMQDGPMLEDFQEYGQALEMNDSMVHLHIGFERRKGVALLTLLTLFIPGASAPCWGSSATKVRHRVKSALLKPACFTAAQAPLSAAHSRTLRL